MASVAKTTGKQHIVSEVVAVDDDDDADDDDDDTSSVNAKIGGTVDLDRGASSRLRTRVGPRHSCLVVLVSITGRWMLASCLSPVMPPALRNVAAPAPAERGLEPHSAEHRRPTAHHTSSPTAPTVSLTFNKQRGPCRNLLFWTRPVGGRSRTQFAISLYDEDDAIAEEALAPGVPIGKALVGR